MKKILTTITILLICMTMVSAVWWNPFTWFDEGTNETYTTDELNLETEQLISQPTLDLETEEYYELKSLADPTSYSQEYLDGVFYEYKTEYYLDNQTRKEQRQRLVNNTYEKEYYNELTNETYWQKYQKEEQLNYTVDITEQLQKSNTWTYKRYNNNTLRQEELNDAARFHRDNEYLENLNEQLPANTALIGSRVYGLIQVPEYVYESVWKEEQGFFEHELVLQNNPYIIKYSDSMENGELQLTPLEKYNIADFYSQDMDANSNNYRYSVLNALGLE